MENHLKKELNFMHNLSNYVEQQGIENGITQSIQQSMVLRKHAIGQAPKKEPRICL